MATILGTTTSKGAGNYIGETKKQLRDGFGVFNYPNKFFRYEGEWSKGKKHGHGKLLMADGSFYEGQFHDGEIQGHGFRYWSISGNKYTGQFVKGELYGNGIMKYGDGSCYEGEWMENRWEGNGKLTDAKWCLYEGSFHNHKRHGEGKQTYSNGDVYEGDWVQGLRQGHGIIKTEEGTIYAGQWWGGVYHGEGSMVHSSGMAYEGIWVSGRPEVVAVALRIVGKSQIDITQGRPFGLEVECVTAEGELVTEEGRLLQVTGWVRVTGKKTQTETDSTDERLPTPFGFEVEPYHLTESLGDISENLGTNMACTAPSSSMSNHPVQSSSPTNDSTADITRGQADSVHIPEVTYEGASEAGSLAESHMDVPNRTTAPSQASTMHNASFDKGAPLVEDIVMPPPPSSTRTTAGKAVFENLYLPPLPPGVKSFTSLSTFETRPPEYERRSSLMRWKKAGSIVNPNLIAKANVPGSIGEGGTGKKKKGKEEMADIVEKAEAKEGIKSRKKEKKEEKTEERLCKPGDYVIVVQDITTPRFLDSRLAPAFFHIRVNPKKRAKSKMDSRKN